MNDAGTVHEQIAAPAAELAGKDAKHLADQATRCRRLAKSINDKRTAETLTLMAGEYEQQARSLQSRS